jgi:plasmid replication initiation protein
MLTYQERDDLRNYKVVKANTLIQKSRFRFSTQQQKALLYIVSKLKPDQTDFDWIEFDIPTFCEICGILPSSGKNYSDLKAALKGLRDISIWVELEDGSEQTLSWLSSVNVRSRSGMVKVKIDELMKPYLLQLRDHFTSYDLLYTLALRSKYAIQLYELLKSYQYRKRFSIELDKLQRLLDAENYERWFNFKVKVLEQARKEIEEYTDINFTYTTSTKGKRVIGVNFEIDEKMAIQERLETWVDIEKVLENRRDRPALVGK